MRVYMECWLLCSLLRRELRPVGPVRLRSFESDLANLLLGWWCRNPETQETVRRFPALVEYVETIHEMYFSDYEGWTGEGEKEN